MLLASLSGFVTGLSLIVAIGAQNAFVLRQGLRRRHVALVVAVCALSDLLLILAGVAGIGTLVERAPAVLVVVRWAGAAFLVGYGLLAARRAVRGGRLEAAEDRPLSAGAVLAAALAFTWLNPHVYLDTVLLVGSVASAHGDPGRWWFALGAGLASITWFTALGFGARALTPVFRRPGAWRVLDAVIAVVMLALAASLLLSG
ncbi:LysE/ArgO family amino acid transporter [Microlunatus capsulatus]|uniref:L-lysine exporter family protein LysE/ArgO n=1 Tax=Microlunatus capsulatus TaxID=99117 RepID=A0ABS4Z5G7_9ACTN|nr:LysE/ArgO family amino acid transporter [Microlunatus capsulatus]MBP2416272.1 L-lysine exporter family protein LysE/ArgO [Microlunatus capsulatus]